MDDEVSYKQPSNDPFLERIKEKLEDELHIKAFPEEEESIDEVPIEDINNLRQILDSISSMLMKSTDIYDVNEIVQNMKPVYIPDEMVREIVEKIPRIPYLPNNEMIISLLNHISFSKSKAIVISNTKFVQSINFSHYPQLNHDYASMIATLILHLVDAVESDLEIFYNIFFDHFIDYLTSPTVHTNEKLGICIDLAIRFVKLCNPNQFNKIFTIFMTFSERTTDDCIIPSLHGIALCLYLNNDYIQQTKQETFLSRIKYLATRTCLRNDIGSKKVNFAAFVIFEFILSQRSIKCDSSVYTTIAHVIVKNMDPKNEITCSEAIILLGFAVSNQYFVRSTEYSSIIPMFFMIFESLKVIDQIQWISTFANIIYFLPLDFVQQMFMDNVFLQRINECLIFDSTEIIIKLIIAIHRIYHSSPECIKYTLQNYPDLIQTFESLLDNEDQLFARHVEAVLNIFKQQQQD